MKILLLLSERSFENNDSFFLSWVAFQIAGQPEESIAVLSILTDNAVTERRYRDASYLYWLLSQISLNLKRSPEELRELCLSYYDKADIYYAYHEIFKYLVSY